MIYGATETHRLRFWKANTTKTSKLRSSSSSMEVVGDQEHIWILLAPPKFAI